MVDAPARPIVTLVDLTSVYLRGFVPEGQIGAGARSGSRRAFTSTRIPTSRSTRTYRASIPQATFTPENTYFRDDRVKQVVGVKLQLKGAVGFAKPGMPADGEILVIGSEWPNGQRTRTMPSSQPRLGGDDSQRMTSRYGSPTCRSYGDVEAVRGIDLRQSPGRDLRSDRPGRRGQDVRRSRFSPA